MGWGGDVVKTCKACKEPKPIGEFRKLAPMIIARMADSDGHSDTCKACKKLQRAERREAPPQPEPEPDPNTPRLNLPHCMAVEVEYDGTDFVLSQVNEGTTHVVYVAPHQMRRIIEFAEELAQQQRAEAAAQPLLEVSGS